MLPAECIIVTKCKSRHSQSKPNQQKEATKMNANQINYKIGFARGLSGAELPFAAVVNNPVLDAGFRMGRHVMFKRIPSDYANINKINWMMGFKVGKSGGHLTMEQALNDAALSGYNNGCMAAEAASVVHTTKNKKYNLGVEDFLRFMFQNVGDRHSLQELLDCGYKENNLVPSISGMKNDKFCGNGQKIFLKRTKVDSVVYYTREA